MKRDVLKTEFLTFAYQNPIAMLCWLPLVLQVAYMKQDHLKTLGPYFVPRLQLWKTRISKGAEKQPSWFMML